MGIFLNEPAMDFFIQDRNGVGIFAANTTDSSINLYDGLYGFSGADSLAVFSGGLILAGGLTATQDFIYDHVSGAYEGAVLTAFDSSGFVVWGDPPNHLYQSIGYFSGLAAVSDTIYDYTFEEEDFTENGDGIVLDMDLDIQHYGTDDTLHLKVHSNWDAVGGGADYFFSKDSLLVTNRANLELKVKVVRGSTNDLATYKAKMCYSVDTGEPSVYSGVEAGEVTCWMDNLQTSTTPEWDNAPLRLVVIAILEQGAVDIHSAGIQLSKLK
jgi:hypothetical protein